MSVLTSNRMTERANADTNANWCDKLDKSLKLLLVLCCIGSLFQLRSGSSPSNVPKRNLRWLMIVASSFLQAGYPSCHPANSSKALKGTNQFKTTSINFTIWFYLIRRTRRPAAEMAASIHGPHCDEQRTTNSNFLSVPVKLNFNPYCLKMVLLVTVAYICRKIWGGGSGSVRSSHQTVSDYIYTSMISKHSIPVPDSL